MLRITNIPELQRSVERISNEVVKIAVGVVNETARSTAEFISQGSPVLTGRYRASHNVSVGQIDLSTSRERLSTQEFAALIANPLSPPDLPGKGFYGANDIGQPVIFSNSISYANDVERNHAVYALGFQACGKFLAQSIQRVNSQRIF